MNRLLIIALVFSITLNGVAGAFIFKKGLNITNNYHTENHQHQNQQQSTSTIVFRDVTSRANIIWKFISYSDARQYCGIPNEPSCGKIAEKYLNTMTPGEVIAAKIFNDGLIIGVEPAK